MKCGYCGKPLRENAKFCTNCGRSISDTSAQPGKSSGQKGGSSFGAVFSLILVVGIILVGCAGLIYNGINDWNTASRKIPTADSAVSSAVSPSDTAAVPEFKGDPALLGIWICTDKTAAGYSESDYEVFAEIRLAFNDDGTFTLNFDVENTDIQVRKITITGVYSADNGVFSLFPDLSAYDGDYFNIHGENQSVKYSTADNKLTIVTADNRQVIFMAV